MTTETLNKAAEISHYINSLQELLGIVADEFKPKGDTWSFSERLKRVEFLLRNAQIDLSEIEDLKNKIFECAKKIAHENLEVYSKEFAAL